MRRVRLKLDTRAGGQVGWFLYSFAVNIHIIYEATILRASIDANASS
jgi:hypothetical protein